MNRWNGARPWLGRHGHAPLRGVCETLLRGCARAHDCLCRRRRPPPSPTAPPPAHCAALLQARQSLPAHLRDLEALYSSVKAQASPRQGRSTPAKPERSPAGACSPTASQPPSLPIPPHAGGAGRGCGIAAAGSPANHRPRVAAARAARHCRRPARLAAAASCAAAAGHTQPAQRTAARARQPRRLAPPRAAPGSRAASEPRPACPQPVGGGAGARRAAAAGACRLGLGRRVGSQQRRPTSGGAAGLVPLLCGTPV